MLGVLNMWYWIVVMLLYLIVQLLISIYIPDIDEEGVDIWTW